MNNSTEWKLLLCRLNKFQAMLKIYKYFLPGESQPSQIIILVAYLIKIKVHIHWKRGCLVDVNNLLNTFRDIVTYNVNSYFENISKVYWICDILAVPFYPFGSIGWLLFRFGFKCGILILKCRRNFVFVVNYKNLENSQLNILVRTYIVAQFY